MDRYRCLLAAIFTLTLFAAFASAEVAQSNPHELSVRWPFDARQFDTAQREIDAGYRSDGQALAHQAADLKSFINGAVPIMPCSDSMWTTEDIAVVERSL